MYDFKGEDFLPVVCGAPEDAFLDILKRRGLPSAQKLSLIHI